jgi:hypothetical protein
MTHLNLYALSPLPPLFSDPSRARTNWLGKCTVVAKTPEAARQFVNIATGTASNHSGIPSPWMEPELVECAALPEGADALSAEGLVKFPEGAGRLDFMASGPNVGEVWPYFKVSR